MYYQMNLLDSLNAISSPESVDGRLPSDLPDGATSAECGQEAALVNLSARQAKELGLMTSGTCGPHSTTSLASANLQLCLESKLQVLLDVNGSPEYRLIWSRQTIGVRGQICALLGRLNPTSDSDFSGLPTPTVNSILEKTCPVIDGRVRLLPSGALRKTSKKGIEGSMNFSQWVLAKGLIPTPKLALFFMGYPMSWLYCGERVIPSARRSGKDSSERTFPVRKGVGHNVELTGSL